MESVKRVLSNWGPVLIGLLVLGLLGYLQRGRALSGQNDFSQLYVAAQLAGTEDLYSRPANLAAIERIHGFHMETVVYTRPPFYAVLLRPLAALPYLWAYALFSLLSLSAMLWFIWRFSRECPPLPFFSAFSLPLLSTLCGGQDTAFLLPIMGGTVLLHRRGRLLAAGAVLALGSIKFHLLLFIPVLLLARRQWRMLSGGALGVAALFVLGVAVNGLGSSRAYVNVLLDPWINPSATIMPNLHGLAAVMGWSARVEAALSVGVLLAFLWISQRSRCERFELLLALALVCGLLTSVHSGIPDDVLLLASFALIFTNSADALLRGIAALILTPVPYLLVLAGAPYSAAFPVALLGLLLAACIRLQQGGAVASPTDAQTPPSPHQREAA